MSAIRSKLVPLIIAALLVVLVGGVVFAQKNSQTSEGMGTASSTASSLTMEEVVKHNTRESCWSMINGSVYDLTSWIPRHPGGEQGILGLCGTDGSARFNGKHGGSAQHEAVLAGFKVTGSGSVQTAPATAVPNAGEDDRSRNRRGRDD